MVTISIVSHCQVRMLNLIVTDILRYIDTDFELIITHNVAESACVDIPKNKRIVVIRNTRPQGFGANHNAAFKASSGDFFCVLNPDIRLNSNPFPTLLKLASQEGVGVVAPIIFRPDGSSEDSARKFPSPLELLGKVFGGTSAIHTGSGSVQDPDWVAGMFMLFPSSVFRKLGGFDERYFLYYEDVDICARLALAGYRRLVCQDVSAIHDARRSSHRDMRYAFLHLQSILRFFSSGVYRQIIQRQRAMTTQSTGSRN